MEQGDQVRGGAMSFTIDSDDIQFVDTNILVYAHDSTAGTKQARARDLIDQLWETRLGCLSVQVMQEFYVVTTQKVANPLEPESAARIIRNLSQWKVHSPIPEDVLGAVALQHRTGVSFWDAMILWSAQQLGCSRLWSEDLNHEQEFDGVRVVNPFVV